MIKLLNQGSRIAKCNGEDTEKVKSVNKGTRQWCKLSTL